jgi:hypothetical protein
MVVAFEQKGAGLEAASHGGAKDELGFGQIESLLCFF